ncbi:MAG: DUF5916 domain-containing protein [Bacteroidota bacterium]
MRKPISLIACYCCLLGLAAFSGFAGTSPKEVRAVRISRPPHIDGLLNDREWEVAVPVSDFTQYDPEEGSPPTEITEVRVLYDEGAVYFGFHLYDSEPDRIVAQLTRRDRSVESDRITIQIDSYHDHQTAFVFVLYASGVQRDGLLLQDGVRFDEQWDAVWESAVQITDIGWIAEIRIPFSAVRFPKQPSQEWGINFRRYISRKRETDEWVVVPRREAAYAGYISKSGHIVGIENIDFPKNSHFLPYVVSKSQDLNIPPGTGEQEFGGNLGVEFNGDLGRNFTVNLSVNPDFGQVEVDEAVLNLTAFETFYPEKRPFFLEGLQFFEFGSAFDAHRHQLFYSRRIGRRPSGLFFLSPGARLIEAPPMFSTILGAAKLTGRTQAGWSVGALSALTDEEHVTVVDSSGRRSKQVVEPFASYSIMRLKKDFWQNSFFGLMATSLSREHRLPVFSGGVDWNLRFAENNYAIDGYIAGVRSTGELGVRGDGSSGRLLAGKIAGEHWLYQATYGYATRRYHINDVGFIRRASEHGGYVQALYKEDKSSWPFLRYLFRAAVEGFWNMDGDRIIQAAEINPYFEFRNFWILNLSYQFDWSVFDDFETRGNGLYRRQAFHSVRARLQTDFRKPAAFVLSVRGVYGAKDLHRREFSLSGKIRATSWMEFEPRASFAFSRDDEAWVIPAGGGTNNFVDPQVSPLPISIFGDRDTDEYDLSLRGTVTFTKDLSLQMFLQVFLARGHYDDDNFRRLVDPRTFAAYDYKASSYFGNPDFNTKTVNANIVLRWEYLPGSTLFVVWTHQRFGDDGDFYTSFGKDLYRAFKQPMDNLFLLKVSYWWSL